MKDSRRVLLIVVALGVALGLLYASPGLAVVARHGLDWPVHYPDEVGSLSTYGKWWLTGDGRWMGDGFSGQLETFYNNLSDVLLNALSSLLDAPPSTVQAVLWGPLLASLLLIVNYAVLAPVLADRWAALLASLIVSTGGATPLFGLSSVSESTRLILHVPFDAVALGTAQSLGWVLFLPSLGLGYLARREFSVRRALGFGACTGLLLQAHTLTFLNAAAAQLAWLVAANVAESPRGPRRRAWLAVLGALLVSFVALVWARGRVSTPLLALLGGGALAATAAFDGHKRFYFWGYGTAALVAVPYLAGVGPHLRAVPTTELATAVGPGEVLLFFAVYLLAAVLAFRSGGDSSARTWATAILFATALLAFNHLWGWVNHPYRFAIHLVFPLGVLAALGVRRSPLALAGLLVALLAAPSIENVREFLRGERPHARLVDEGPEAAAFLRAVREATSGPEARESLLLNPAEHAYPQGVSSNTVLLSYSRRPGFVPDYRYVLARERYFNRLALFCFLFPGYPAHDLHLDRRACEETLDPPPDVVGLREPALRASVLPVYGIGYAAATGVPFSRFLREARSEYGWEVVAESPGRRLLRTLPPARAGWARLGRGRWDENGLSLGVEVDEGGPQVVVLGGRRLSERAAAVALDARPLVSRARSANWAVFEADIDRGPHRIELRWPPTSDPRDPDYLYFAAIVAAGRASDSLDLPARGNETAEARVSSSGDKP